MTGPVSNVLHPKVAYAHEVVVYSIDDLITNSAIKYGVSRKRLYETLACESANFTVLDGQSSVPDPDGPNGYENSWGIAQFNLPSSLTTADGRTITKEIAIIPEEAIDAAAYLFSIGKAGRWTCYHLTNETRVTP